MADFQERLGVERPVVQAGMGGGLAMAELAAAASNAGGLGTVGILTDARAFAAELRRARALAPGRPIAANPLLPFARRAHFEACVEAGVDAAALFCGSAQRGVARLRGAGILVMALLHAHLRSRERPAISPAPFWCRRARGKPVADGRERIPA